MNFTIQEKLLSIIPHIIALLPIPLLNIVLVYVYRMIVGNDSLLVENHTRNNINFQLSYQIYLLCLFLLINLIAFASSTFDITAIDLSPLLTIIGVGVGLITIGLLLILGLVITAILIFAIVKALLGEYIKFPLTIRFLK
ncbi:DUF4870 domain-containing protein [Aquisalibacillus elongatus]|uniref:Putative Tic20 family protein n=1 Tax=Aquisalibacillus elongatus TaxID=485577 RepID=A0A3N5BDV1_9BACI|nr:DUF4870 domain-containing protein [Aquisalibacillus elongatus]RPF55866.1 putative Tic20 family protein [Aquisalibacillus elongatus]